MGKVNIELSGITSTSTYPDGEMISLVNLRKKGGALEPVPPRATVKALTRDGGIVFVHSVPNQGKEWINVVGDDIYHQKPASEILIGSASGIKTVSQIGNVLIFTTETNKLYAIYKDGGYLFLGELPELPAVNIRPFPVKTKSNPSTVTTNAADFVKDVQSLAYDLLNQTFTTDGYALQDAHFLMLAFKLYDGSYVKHSMPLLLLPPGDIFNTKIVEWFVYEGELDINITAYIKTYGVYFNEFDSSLPGLSDWKDVITSLDFFLSPSLGLTNIEEMDKFKYAVPTTKPSIIQTGSYRLIPSLLESAKDNIRDVSQFHLIRSIPTEQGGYTPNVTLSQFPSGQLSLLDKKDDDNIKNLSGKIELRDLFSASRETWGAKKAYTYNSRLHLANIRKRVFEGFSPRSFAVYGGVLSQDDYPYNGHTYPWSFEYYLYDKFVAIEVKIKLPTGTVSVWSYDDMENVWLGSPYFSYPDSRAISATFYCKYGAEPEYKKMREVGLKPHDFLNSAYYLEASLSPIETSTGLIVSPQQPEDERPAFVSEPNMLKVSETNNPFVFQDNNAITVGSGEITGMISNAKAVSEGQFGQFPLYVMTTDLVFALSVGQDIAYTTKSPISNEAPLGESFCATPFGIVFRAKRGLFIINGQSVDYLSQGLESYPTQISLDIPKVGVLPNRADIKTWNDHFLEYLDGITEIAFDNKESEIILLNPSKEDYNFVYNIPSKMWYQSTEIVDGFVQNAQPELYGLRGKDIIDFSRPSTAQVQIIEYTTATQETIIVADGSLVPVVIDGEQLSWFVIIDDVVVMLAEGESVTVQPGQTIGRYTGLKEEPVKTAVSIVTRPLNFGLYDLKKLERVILRARLDAADDVVILTNNAIDDINFSLDKGMKLNNANYKDIYLGMMTKKYRQIVLMFSAKLGYTSRIYSIDAMVEKANEKMI